ncbi:MAG TPA: hypothetical protein VFA56_13020 [Gaiellaceae bacterium]|nr:hypothetical protein [Gaiellaceae bacterium]
MTRRRFMCLAVALVALNAFFWLATTGFALPRAVINQFFGNQMVRAEVLLRNGQDWRIDRGVVQTYAAGTVALREADGTSVSIPVSPTARIQGGRQIRPRMRVVVYHQANLPAEVVQVEGFGG